MRRNVPCGEGWEIAGKKESARPPVVKHQIVQKQRALRGGGGVRSPQIFFVLRLFRLFMYPRQSVVSGVGNCFFARKGLSASAKQNKTKTKTGYTREE